MDTALDTTTKTASDRDARRTTLLTLGRASAAVFTAGIVGLCIPTFPGYYHTDDPGLIAAIIATTLVLGAIALVAYALLLRHSVRTRNQPLRPGILLTAALTTGGTWFSVGFGWENTLSALSPHFPAYSLLQTATWWLAAAAAAAFAVVVLRGRPSAQRT